MKKKKMLVIVIAIAIVAACMHHSIQKQGSKKQLPKKEVTLPYMPTTFNDVCLFPGNFFQFLINNL